MKRMVSAMMLAIMLLVAFAIPINPARATVQSISLNPAQFSVQDISVILTIDTPNYKEGFATVKLKECVLDFYFKINVTQNGSETYYAITITNSESAEMQVYASVPDKLYDAPSGVAVDAFRLDIPGWVVDILIPTLFGATIVLVAYLIYARLLPLLYGDLLEFFNGLGGFVWASIPWIFLTLCSDRNPDGSLTLYFPYSPVEYIINFLASFSYPLATEYGWWLIVKKSWTFLWFTFTWFEAIWLYSRVSQIPLNKPPSASFVWTPETPSIGQEVTFISTSFDPDGYIVDIHWWFGDGSEASGNITTHAYTKAGNHRVTLKVTDNQGLSSTVYSNITVIIPVILEIASSSLNLKSKGKWITAYIEFPEGYNVGDINISSILLNGTIPVNMSAPTAVGDYDSDGTPDLMVRFNRTAVCQLILSRGVMVGNVTLTVSGKLYDGTEFEGSGTIRVRMPGDINMDGKVDTKDISIICKAFGSFPNHPRWNPIADENEDNKIDIADIALTCRNFGKTYK